MRSIPLGPEILTKSATQYISVYQKLSFKILILAKNVTNTRVIKT